MVYASYPWWLDAIWTAGFVVLGGFAWYLFEAASPEPRGERTRERGQRFPLPRLTLGLALLAVLVWCCLLFGIGLNDLGNTGTEPGAIVAFVALPIVIGSLLYASWRLVLSGIVGRLTRRFARSS